MNCPKCHASMETVPAAYGQNVARCQHCRGLFVPEAALESLSKHWYLWPDYKSEEKIDTGDRTIGRAYDGVDRIECPVCIRVMDKVIVSDQTHIWLEQCGQCNGVFFDAWELTDLRYKTLADWVRDRAKGKREGASPARLPHGGKS